MHSGHHPSLQHIWIVCLYVSLPDGSLNPSMGPVEILEHPLISATIVEKGYLRILIFKNNKNNNK